MFETRLGEMPAPIASRRSPGPVHISGIRVEPEDADEIRTGGRVRLTLDYVAGEAIDIIWGFSVWTYDQWVCVTGDSDMIGMQLEPGPGELSCVIPRLPLLPGRYVVRAMINDPVAHHLIAEYGLHGRGLVLDVRAFGSILTNAQVKLGQLMSIDVDWGREGAST